MGETTNSTATAEVPELTVNITVKGEYLPPPEIVFDDVVVEVFEEEEENYIGKIDESDNEYFEPVISKTSVKAEVIVEVEPEISKSSGSPFGVLGDTGGITSIVIGGIIIMVSVLLLYKKQIRKVEREVRKEELKNQVLLRDESSMFVGGDAYRSSNEAMRNLRVTMSNTPFMSSQGFHTISTASMVSDAGSQISQPTSMNDSRFDESSRGVVGAHFVDPSTSHQASEKAEYMWRSQVRRHNSAASVNVNITSSSEENISRPQAHASFSTNQMTDVDNDNSDEEAGYAGSSSSSADDSTSTEQLIHSSFHQSRLLDPVTECLDVDEDDDVDSNASSDVEPGENCNIQNGDFSQQIMSVPEIEIDNDNDASSASSVLSSMLDPLSEIEPGEHAGMQY